MNTISILDKLCMWLLQQQNVKRDIIEKKITATATPAVATTPDLISADGGANIGASAGDDATVIGSS
jgi:hypothetical protein